jgi:hypothetical protein
MPFEKGKSGNPKGRNKGSINESTKQLRTVKEVVLKTFLKREETPETSLAAFADEYPKEFYQIAAKLIPNEITGDIKATIKFKDAE